MVCGIDPKAAKERLLRDTELNLDKTINFMRTYETSKTQVKALETTIQAGAVNKQGNRIQFNSQKNDQPIKKCCHCCGSQHANSSCPAYGLRCALWKTAPFCKSMSPKSNNLKNFKADILGTLNGHCRKKRWILKIVC